MEMERTKTILKKKNGGRILILDFKTWNYGNDYHMIVALQTYRSIEQNTSMEIDPHMLLIDFSTKVPWKINVK